MTTLVPKELLDKLNGLEGFMRQHLIGQNEVIAEVSSLLRQSFCGMWFDGQPAASLLLLGPTGVGKTNMVELCNEYLFGAPNKLIRLDMSEFQQQSALERLIGNRLGERGLFGFYYDKAEGSGVVLFDEIEKADERVLDILLQILSAGRFTLGNGETLDLSKFIVAATSNIGARVLMVSRSTDRETLVRRTHTAVEAIMRPELVARFDLVTSFNKFDFETLNAIAELHMEKCLRIINGRGHEISAGSDVLQHIQREGYSEKFGARPVRSAAMRILGGMVTQEMIRNGGRPVSGTIRHDRRTNTCALV
jgi:ATP-dependent Clp protease ATP-binding subunit ClpA